MVKIWISMNTLGANRDIFLDQIEDLNKFLDALRTTGTVTLWELNANYTGYPKRSEYISVEVYDKYSREKALIIIKQWRDTFIYTGLTILKNQPDLKYYNRGHPRSGLPRHLRL